LRFDVVLNCVLRAMFTACDVEPRSPPPAPPATFSPPPPHPQSRTKAESGKILAQCFMEFSPGRFWRSWTDVASNQSVLVRNGSSPGLERQFVALQLPE